MRATPIQRIKVLFIKNSYKLITGEIIPIHANPASSAKIPSHKTTTPADLKKSGAYVDFENPSAPNERSARTGKVPRAKESMISPPVM